MAFVFLAPWVGSYADARPKAWVMTSANIVKGVNAAMMMLHIEPLLSYAIVGLAGQSRYVPRF